MTSQRRPLRPGDYVWQRHANGPGHQRPGQVTSTRDASHGGFVQAGEGWVFVHWLHDVARGQVHPMPEQELVYAEHDPARFNVLDDTDGAPLPHALQQGGQLWHAVLFGLRASPVHHYATGHDLDEAADNIMVTLTEVFAQQPEVLAAVRGDITNDEDSNAPAGPPAASASSRQAVLGTVPTVPPVQL